MKLYPILTIVLCLAGVLSGCATHAYRRGDEGTSFYLRHAQAETVILFSSADGFSPHVAERKGDKWINHLTKTLPATREFTYFYIVDGKILVPDCHLKERDDFGQENCICIPGR